MSRWPDGQKPWSCLNLDVVNQPRNLKQRLGKTDPSRVADFDQLCANHVHTLEMCSHCSHESDGARCLFLGKRLPKRWTSRLPGLTPPNKQGLGGLGSACKRIHHGHSHIHVALIAGGEQNHTPSAAGLASSFAGPLRHLLIEPQSRKECGDAGSQSLRRRSGGPISRLGCLAEDQPRLRG